MPRLDRTTLAILIALTGATLFLWRGVLSPHIGPGFYALDVGQGDATLVVLEGGAKVLTDAGPDRSVVASLEQVLGASDRTIDLAVITHAQLDHFNGFNTILDHFTVGAFITNGRTAEKNGATTEWNTLMEKIRAKNIPLIVVGRGDRIRESGDSIDILSPDGAFVESGEPNDTGIVELVRSGHLRMLLTADTGFSIEEFLVRESDIHADILKVGHHGSKYSTEASFLAAVAPTVVTISDGAGNHYGHPAPETLKRLADESGITVFRTDQQGTIEITAESGALIAKTER